MNEIAHKVVDGDRRSAGRLMRWIDDDDPRARVPLDDLYKHSGAAFFLGITGNPGSGKSTLVDQLITKYRAEGKRVGCIAIDPTSPFSGGAILGDRVRMGRHGTDEGVFIRSAATRGNLGGISRSTPSLMVVLDAMGFDVVIVETVGVGQSEIDVAGVCDVNVVVVVPGLGDEVQAAKAGLFEIADIFAVNKSERDGADRLVRELHTSVALGDVEVPIVKTIATQGDGVQDLFEQIARISGVTPDKKRRRAHSLVRLVSNDRFNKQLEAFLEAYPELLDEIADRSRSPFDVVDQFHTWLS